MKQLVLLVSDWLIGFGFNLGMSYRSDAEVRAFLALVETARHEASSRPERLTKT